MPGTMEVDSQWVIETLNSISQAVATLPLIEAHLARQNSSIEKNALACSDYAVRLAALELRQHRQEKRWTNIGSVILKIIEGISITVLLAKVFGLP